MKETELKQIEELKSHLDTMIGNSSQLKAEKLVKLGYRRQSEGKWLRYGYDSQKCSLCGNVNTNYINNNFCPNCGAKMKGGAE